MTDSISYYDRYAHAFAMQTANLDLEPLYQRFLRHVRAGGRILDAGCGPGRDALAFAERGYQVVAFDASAAMVRLARERVGHRAVVYLMRLEELDWQSEVDGIWTCASLLHVPRTSLTSVATRLAQALQPGGAWYMSFKLGSGERMTEGRLFVDYTAESLFNSLAAVPIDIVETWVSNDIRPNHAGEPWLNAIAVRGRGQPTS
jgi:2-polyprenyl-3-methyl-5-hydroxy-6-metoxy-1,4-benzoquinol methylase